jgi:phosphate starvation-inducible PhoH-like protein
MDNGSIATSPKTTDGNAATSLVLAFDDNRLASVLFGQYGQNLALIERRLGVVAEQRGNHVSIAGSRDGVEQARRVLEGLYERLRHGDELVSGDVEGAIRLAIAQGSLFDYDPATAQASFEEINLRKRSQIRFTNDFFVFTIIDGDHFKNISGRKAKRKFSLKNPC